MSGSTYEYWLGYLRFPVAPKTKEKYESNNERYQTLNYHENIDTGHPKLTEIQLDAFFPHTQYPMNDGILRKISSTIENSIPITDQPFIKYLKGLVRTGEPVQYIVIRLLPNKISIFNTNLTVIVDSFEYEESEGYDITGQIKLIEKKIEQTETLTTFGDQYMEFVKYRLPPMNPKAIFYYTVMRQTISSSLQYIQQEYPSMNVNEEIIKERNKNLIKKYGMNQELPRGTKIDIGYQTQS